MQKRLTFTADGPDRLTFDQLWDGITLGSLPAGQPPTPKSRAQTRREAALQKKLIAVSLPTQDLDRTLRPANGRSLKPGPQQLDLTVEEITLAGELTEKVPWGGSQVIQVAAVYDLLEGASTIPEPETS